MPNEEVRHIAVLIAYVVDVESIDMNGVMEKLREDGGARVVDTMFVLGPTGDYDGLALEIANDIRRKLNG